MPRTDTTETVTPAADQKPLTVHLRCRYCEPVWRLGMAAVCGEKMLGIPLPEDTAVGCAECERHWPGHMERHEKEWLE